MSEITRINVTFPVAVELPSAAHQALHDAIELVCATYQRAHKDRVMWAAGEGGTPPPGFFFDEPKGDWDMSVLNIEVAERERYDTDEDFKPNASAELRDYMVKEIDRLERGLVRHRELAQSDHPEIRLGGQTFTRKYERELRVLRLAQRALSMLPSQPTQQGDAS